MNKKLIYSTMTLFMAFLSISASKMNAEYINSFSGVQYAFINNSSFVSSSIKKNNNDGEFKTISELGGILALTPGQYLECEFKLPDNADNVRIKIEYDAQNDSKGQIRGNDKLLTKYLSKNAQQGFSILEIPLDNAQVQNKLRIFSLNGELGIHQIRIAYNYRMPFSSAHGVTAVLTSPVTNTDVVQKNMRFEWKVNGEFNAGWVSLEYLDNKEWKTVPGAELIDCHAAKKNEHYCEFLWENHGLTAIPKIRIVYHDYTDPLPRKFSRTMRSFVLKNTSSVDDYVALIKRFLAEDNDTLNKIDLKCQTITVFEPSRRTWGEWFTMKKRQKNKDFRVKYCLLDQNAIKNDLSIFNELENDIKNLKDELLNRMLQEKSKEPKKKLSSIKPDLDKFQAKVHKERKCYLSYSVISPNLAAIDRALYWKLSEQDYKDCLETIRFMNQNDWIQECYGDVQKQFTDLLKKYSILKTCFKVNIEKELQKPVEQAIKSLQELQKTTDKLRENETVKIMNREK